ncbi:phospho-sugar mutase [Clostridium cylindrosporum]|uniref:Phosphoglucomutase n=1 Tax=Clostridium cylindrosporum DSM 605 TaxID=1121307 RepID=A0A0J8D9A9_CLOCY|nr:phospho-sugar mutase [Clostridium cylindrosporum]KMT22620.1 phosphoglucomutase PgcA [Clostridium cylindrosporum DSM 605]
MDIERLCNEWKTFDKDTENELDFLNSEEIEDRFYKEIKFGTGGIRGKIGAGTNRINYYTIARATRGVSNFLIKNFEKPSVVIAYDSRKFSLEFSLLSAYVFSSYGIKVKVFKEPTPTPILSYAVRRLNASIGIVITASHNPKEYNGYKVYGEDGGQIIKKVSDEIFSEISKLDYKFDIKSFKNVMLNNEVDFHYVDNFVLDEYIDNVYKLSHNKSLIRRMGDRIKVVYTPLHGTGGEPIKRVFDKLGFSNLYFVKSQRYPDGNFPTVTCPNPEEKDVFDLAVRVGMEKKAEILIATDPDCDRVGVMVRDKKGEYTPLTGNQIGTILTYYILSQLSDKGEINNNYVIVKTIVTTDITKAICDDFNVKMESVLTGFKYIGERIKEYEGKKDKEFLLGFEESYGYLVGSFVRDKDAVIASSLICEMALYYKGLNMSLLDVMDKIYKKYGYYKEKLLSFVLDGKDGENTIRIIMEKVIDNDFIKSIGIENCTLLDYRKGIDSLPCENVVSIESSRGKITIRPSGTEPKIKFYISSKGKTCDEALDYISEFEGIVNKMMKIVHNIGD